MSGALLCGLAWRSHDFLLRGVTQMLDFIANYFCLRFGGQIVWY
jgi:hypothetical protein